MKKTLKTLCAAIFWIAVWWLLAAHIGSALLLPTPPATLGRLLTLCGTAELWRTVAVTLLRILCGAVAGGAVVLGLYGLEDRAIVEDYYARLTKNHPESLNCADLLELNEQRGGVKKPHCDALVYEVIRVVEEMLREHGKLA